MSEKYQKTYKYLNYVEDLLILSSTVTGCVSISASASLLSVSVGIKSSAVGTKVRAITAGIKHYKSIMNKIKKKHGKIVLLGTAKLNTIEDTIWSREVFIINSVLKTNPWIYKVKDLNREKHLGSLYEKKLSLIYYK